MSCSGSSSCGGCWVRQLISQRRTNSRAVAPQAPGPAAAPVRGAIEYNKDKKIDEGSAATIYEGSFAFTSRGPKICAVKVFPDLRSPQQLERVEHEVEIMQKVRSPHACQFFGWAIVPGTVGNNDIEVPMIAMERCETNLEKYMIANPGLSLQCRVRLCNQASLGLAAIHSFGIAHNDLRPKNLLITTTSRKDVVLKIADLGEARDVQNTQKHDVSMSMVPYLVGHELSRIRRAPEMHDPHGEVSASVDVWALGCIFFFALALNGEAGLEYKFVSPFATTRELQSNPSLETKRILENNPTNLDWSMSSPWPSQPTWCMITARGLLADMLAWHPSRRPRTKQLPQHPLFNLEDSDAALAWPEPESSQFRTRATRVLDDVDKFWKLMNHGWTLYQRPEVWGYRYIKALEQWRERMQPDDPCYYTEQNPPPSHVKNQPRPYKSGFWELRRYCRALSQHFSDHPGLTQEDAGLLILRKFPELPLALHALFLADERRH